MRALDITGKRYGRLTVLERAGSYQTCGDYPTTLALWRCKCDCGEVVVVLGQNLRRGMTRSCGCLRREKMREIATRKKAQDKKVKTEDDKCQKSQG